MLVQLRRGPSGAAGRILRAPPCSSRGRRREAPLGWDEIAPDIERRSLGRTIVPIVGRATLIALKRHSGRPQDLADVEHLLEVERDG